MIESCLTLFAGYVLAYFAFHLSVPQSFAVLLLALGIAGAAGELAAGLIREGDES